MTVIKQLDEIPGSTLLDMPTAPATVYDKPNRKHGHLLIESGGSDYVFINDGGGVVRFGHFAGPTVGLSPGDLRTIGDYCHRMADRLEANS